MCLIIDINIAQKVLLIDNDPDFSLVHTCLFNGHPYNARLIYGGEKLLNEYAGNDAVRRRIVSLDRAGKALKVDDSLVNDEEEKIKISGLCSSDDEHIIALAKISGVRLLCSHDKKLHDDFTNKTVISSPRGKVYQKPSHRHLLRRFCS